MVSLWHFSFLLCLSASVTFWFLAHDKQGGIEAKYWLCLCAYPLPLLCQAKGITGPWTPTVRRCSTMEISAGRGRENQMSPPARALWPQRKRRPVSWEAAPETAEFRTSWMALHRAPPFPRRRGQRRPARHPMPQQLPLDHVSLCERAEPPWSFSKATTPDWSLEPADKAGQNSLSFSSYTPSPTSAALRVGVSGPALCPATLWALGALSSISSAPLLRERQHEQRPAAPREGTEV